MVSFPTPSVLFCISRGLIKNAESRSFCKILLKKAVGVRRVGGGSRLHLAHAQHIAGSWWRLAHGEIQHSPPDLQLPQDGGGFRFRAAVVTVHCVLKCPPTEYWATLSDVDLRGWAHMVSGPVEPCSLSVPVQAAWGPLSASH